MRAKGTGNRRGTGNTRGREYSHAGALTAEELRSIRLSDLEGLYQEEAARIMGISRATFARLVFSARRKIAASLCSGRPVEVPGMREESGPKAVRCPIHGGRKRGGRLCLCRGDRNDGR